MKKILLSSIIILSLCFSGTFYVEMGSAPEFEVGGASQELDSGGLSIGYNHGFFQKGSWSASLGASYTLNPITGIRQPEGFRFQPTNSEVGFLSVYVLPVYQIGEKFFAWASIGITKGLYDLDLDYDFENGNTIGYGIHVKCDDVYGIGAGFTTNTVTLDGDDYDFRRTSIFLTAKIN